MKKAITQEQKQDLRELAEAVLSQHSFLYSTLAEAKKTVQVGEYYYCFDALSLCCYQTNLPSELYSEFKAILIQAYNRLFNNEAKKEREERESLFRYLQSDSCPYADYTIKKETRPDFVLEGKNEKIGIEVVGLTTPEDQVLFAISNENFGKNKTAVEIEIAASQKYGAKAQQYNYWDINGSACIGRGLVDVDGEQKWFASLLIRKYKKYESVIPYFNKFIVLGDAQRDGDITISKEEDIENIREWLACYTGLANVTFVILWQGSDSKGYCSQFDF